MTKHVDEVARAIKKCRPMGETVSYEEAARAAMRAVVKQLREPSEGMFRAAYDVFVLAANASVCWQSMLDAYVKEAEIDE